RSSTRGGNSPRCRWRSRCPHTATTGRTGRDSRQWTPRILASATSADRRASGGRTSAGRATAASRAERGRTVSTTGPLGTRAGTGRSACGDASPLEDRDEGAVPGVHEVLTLGPVREVMGESLGVLGGEDHRAVRDRWVVEVLPDDLLS